MNATNMSNPTYFRQMNVIAVYDAEKIVEVMFGGAWSGIYSISVRHKTYGLLETGSLQLAVGSNVTNVSPQTGSIYGGTVLTITGNNFGKVATDNPVSISTLGAVGAVTCNVLTTGPTGITCRVASTSQTAG